MWDDDEEGKRKAVRTNVTTGHRHTGAGAGNRDGIAIHITDVHVRFVIGRGKACFDFGALRVVVSADGDTASPIGGEEHLSRRAEHTRSGITNWRW